MMNTSILKLCLLLAPFIPGGYPEDLLEVFGESPLTTSGGDWTYELNLDYDPSGSSWAVEFSEREVYLARLGHIQRRDGSPIPWRSWEIRVGRGGQLYSIRSGFGEAIPPQFRSGGSSEAPWVDEVFQIVGVATARNSNEKKYFIHQSGVYLRDPILEEPFYSPLLASGPGSGDSAFVTVNWGQQAHIPTSHRSGLLYYQAVRDAGGSVVEVTNLTYNFGDHTVNRFNAPWGGTRRSSLGHHILSHPDGTHSIQDGNFGDGLSIRLNETGGWVAFAGGDGAGRRALGLVFGRDTHLGRSFRWGDSLWRWGYAGGTPVPDEAGWRNYLVGTVIRKITVQPGQAFLSRYYLVIGSLGNVETMIRNRGLVDHADSAMIRFAEEDTPLLGWRIVNEGGRKSLLASGPGQLPDLYSYSRPVEGSRPLFLLASRDGTQFVSFNPYTLSEKPYDGKTTYVGLLGFALPEDSINQNGNQLAYAALSELLADSGGYYREDGMEMMVRIPPSFEPEFIRGDANADGGVDISDAIYILRGLFAGGPATICPDAADANDDEAQDLTDAIYLLQFLFASGPDLPAPYPECGLDRSGHPHGSTDLPPCGYCPEACQVPPVACPH